MFRTRVLSVVAALVFAVTFASACAGTDAATAPSFEEACTETQGSTSRCE